MDLPEDDVRERLAYRDGKWVAGLIPLLRLVVKTWYRSEVTGMEKLPEGGALMVSNHSGGLIAMDVPVIAVAFHDLYGTDKSKAWGSANGQQVLELYNQLTPYWTPGTQTLGIDDADRAFAQGKAAFDIGGTFTISAIQQNGMDPAKILAFPIPAPEAGAAKDFKLAPFALTGLAVSAQTANRAAALQWLDFLTQPAQAGAFAQAALDLPGTDLGANAEKLVGPYLSSMEAAFGTGDHAWNPGDSTFKGSTWDIQVAGDILVKMSPLKELGPAATNQQLAVYNTSVHSGQ